MSDTMAIFRVKIGNVWPRNDIPEDHVEEWTPPAVTAGVPDDHAAVEDTGVYFFRRDILDKLPEYFEHLAVMRKFDPEAYALYSKIGATLIPPRTMLDATGKLRSARPDELPSFASVVLTTSRDDEPDKIPGRILYYQKLQGVVPRVAVTTDTLFKVTMFYSEGATGRRIGLPVEYHVSVSKDGDVTLLKEFHTEYHSLMSRRRHAVHRSFRIPTSKWRFPYYLREIAGENQQDPAKLGATAFSILANAAHRMDIGFQVRAFNTAGTCAVFNIANKRTPYFFKDRDILVNENGRKKRIFHFVGEYVKTDGKIVKAHTKGLRSFHWNGYRVHIGKPGFDFADMRNFKAPGLWLDNDKHVPAGMMDVKEVGSKMLAHFLAGFIKA